MTFSLSSATIEANLVEVTRMANVLEITDFSAPELDVYARLTEAQLLNRFEPAKGMFIA